MFGAKVLTLLVMVHVSVGFENQYFTEVNPSSKALDFCPECVNFATMALKDGAIGDGCSTLCQNVANKTGLNIWAECDFLCDIVGFKEFVDYIQHAELDPIYFCQLLKVCKVNDNGDAQITVFDITPKKATTGSTFDIDIQYVTENGTGPGMINLDIDTVDGLPQNGQFFHSLQEPGTYEAPLKLRTVRDSDCQTCEKWKPGNYTVHLTVCNGECINHKHPHSQIYDTATASFIITKDKKD